MTTIDPMSTTTPAYNTSPATTTKTDDQRTTLGKNDFLQLFIKSLQYQDPSSPMDTGQMMSQMSQLGLMEQVENMNTAVNQMSTNASNNQIQQSAALLGKNITATDSNGNNVQGIVNQMKVDNGTIDLLVNGHTITIGEIQDVSLSGN